MSTELTIPGIQVPTVYDPNVIDDVSKGSSFAVFPRIDLLQGLSKGVAEEKGRLGEFLVWTGQNATNLGKRFLAVPLVLRPKAMMMHGDILIVNYDGGRNGQPKSPTFQAILEKSKEGKTSGDQGPRYFAGPEYLLWLPEHGQFSTYFCMNVTHKNGASLPFKAATDILASQGKITPLQVSSKLIEKGTNKWYGPVVENYTVPISPNQFPSSEEINSAIQKFLNEESSKAELAEQTNGTSRER